jgi:hypothetical protein
MGSVIICEIDCPSDTRNPDIVDNVMETQNVFMKQKHDPKYINKSDGLTCLVYILEKQRYRSRNTNEKGRKSEGTNSKREKAGIGIDAACEWDIFC